MFLVALGGLVVACSATPAAKAERLCTPDANVFCRCVDRSEGTKKCKPDGQSFEACVPCDGSGDKGVGSGGSDGLGARSRTEDEANPLPEEGTDSTTKSTTLDAGTTPPENPDASTSAADASVVSAGNATPQPDGTDFPDTPHCKALKNIAPRIELQRIADSATTPKGGQPHDGLYVQAWVVEFTGEDGATGPAKSFSRETLEIAGDVGRYVFEDDDGKTTHGGFRLTPSEVGQNKVNVAYECPAAPPKDLAYDASESTLIIYDPPFARIFARQPD